MAISLGTPARPLVHSRSPVLAEYLLKRPLHPGSRRYKKLQETLSLRDETGQFGGSKSAAEATALGRESCAVLRDGGAGTKEEQGSRRRLVMLTMPPNRLPCILGNRTRAVAACTAPPDPTWLSYPGSARRPRSNDLNSNDSKQDAGESGTDQRPENRYAGVTPVRRALACDR